MSEEKKGSPIQPEPFRPFTLRLVNGHFVRVPRVGNPPQTDTTRPPTRPPRKTIPYGDGAVVGRNLRLFNGRFVSDADQPSESATAGDVTPGLEKIDECGVESLDLHTALPEVRRAPTSGVRGPASD